MMYQLLAINIDGTLLKSNGRLTKATKEAIAYAKSKDIYITLVTSRNFPSAKKIARALKLDTQLITHSGAYISKELDKPFYENRLTETDTFDIVQMLENFDCHIRLLHEKYSIGNRVKNRSNLMGKAVFTSNDPLFYPMQFVSSLSNRLLEEPVDPPKINLYFRDQAEKERAIQALHESAFNIDVLVSNHEMVEIVPKSVSKFTALQRLGHQLGIPMHKMMVIGDSFGDIEMIEHAGLGIAMGNAPNEVKKAADWVTRSNNQEGVSYVIKEQFRKQVRTEFLRNVKK